MKYWDQFLVGALVALGVGDFMRAAATDRWWMWDALMGALLILSAMYYASTPEPGKGEDDG